jgi:hypothetical protein
MNGFKRSLVGLAIAAALGAGTANAQVSDGVVKIGVLSDNLRYLGESQATGELGAVTVLSGQAGDGGIGEGTAMLEIIHDLATNVHRIVLGPAFADKVYRKELDAVPRQQDMAHDLSAGAARQPTGRRVGGRGERPCSTQRRRIRPAVESQRDAVLLQPRRDDASRAMGSVEDEVSPTRRCGEERR